MKTYELEFEQFIDLPINDVFDFFSKPENLSLITPPRLKFDILTPTPLEMKEGQLIDYSLKILYLVKLHWRTLITHYDKPYKFIDQQIKGPYTLWHHTHTFEEKDGGTLIKDKLRYAIPFGLLGRLIHFIYIKYDINGIFQYRHKILNQIFKEIKNQSRD
tara:strand:- start:4537 stop:5016 length:480 start_codon:yes stop_codon:yes gene_type:complete